MVFRVADNRMNRRESRAFSRSHLGIRNALAEHYQCGNVNSIVMVFCRGLLSESPLILAFWLAILAGVAILIGLVV
jgi:hypothetical protein